MSDSNASFLDQALSVLQQAQATVRYGISVGFKWASDDGSLDTHKAADKVREEVGELEEALKEGNAAHIKEEAGDLLRAATTMAEYAGVDAEEALATNNKKFAGRFEKTERRLAEKGLTMETAEFREMITAWNAGKPNGPQKS